MSHISTAFLREYAIWSAKDGYDRYGMPLRSAPVEIRCRWETRDEELRFPDGTTAKVDAWVAVDREIGLGDTLVLGRLINYLGTGSSNDGEDEVVHEVVYYEEIPSINARHRRREAYLQRRNSEQPELAS